MNYDVHCGELCFDRLCMCSCEVRKLWKAKQLGRVIFSLLLALSGQSYRKTQKSEYKVTYSHMALYKSENKMNVKQ